MKKDSAQVFESALLGERVASRFAKTFGTPEALRRYLRDHPGADRAKHTVKKNQDGSDVKPKEKPSTSDASSAIKTHTKGLSLNISTLTNLKDVEKAIDSGKADPKKVEKVLADLKHEHNQVRDKKDPESKANAGKLHKLIQTLKPFRDE